MAENNTNETRTKRTFGQWFTDNEEAIIVIGSMVGITTFLGGCIAAGVHQDKIRKELAEKAIDAELEAYKYAEDKKVEKETKVADDIKDIVHDITTLKERN